MGPNNWISSISISKCRINLADYSWQGVYAPVSIDSLGPTFWT
jgi:hypothetical protein